MLDCTHSGMYARFSNILKNYRQRLGLNQKLFAEKIGVTQATVSRWENKKQLPNFEQLRALERMDESFRKYLSPDVLYGTTKKLCAVTVVGRVKAAGWAEERAWPIDERFVITVPPQPQVNPEKQNIYGLVVEGSSMNLVYPDGTILVCLDLHDYDKELVPGDRVIVQRLRSSGEYEMTVKEFDIDEVGRKWLWPRSNDPDHQQPLKFKDGIRDNEEILSVKVVAKVVGSYKME